MKRRVNSKNYSDTCLDDIKSKIYILSPFWAKVLGVSLQVLSDFYEAVHFQREGPAETYLQRPWDRLLTLNLDLDLHLGMACCHFQLHDG